MWPQYLIQKHFNMVSFKSKVILKFNINVSYLDFNYRWFLLTQILHPLSVLFSNQVTSYPRLQLDNEGFVGQPQLFSVIFSRHTADYILTERAKKKKKEIMLTPITAQSLIPVSLLVKQYICSNTWMSSLLSWPAQCSNPSGSSQVLCPLSRL